MKNQKETITTHGTQWHSAEANSVTQELLVAANDGRQAKTCETCKHLGPMDECKPLHEAVYVDAQQHGWDGWSEVIGIDIGDPEGFGCSLHEAKS